MDDAPHRGSDAASSPDPVTPLAESAWAASKGKTLTEKLASFMGAGHVRTWTGRRAQEKPEPLRPAATLICQTRMMLPRYLNAVQQPSHERPAACSRERPHEAKEW